MKRIFGFLLLAALLSAGTLCIAGDTPSARGSAPSGLHSTASCPVPCGMCR
jgi:hypothetical protein